MNLDEVSVLMPDKFGGLTVCGLDQLVAAIDDDESLEDAVTNSAFDSIMSFQPSHEQLQHLIHRVYNLNETGNAKAYWNEESDD